MRLTLVRHGEVTEEYLGKYNGHIDIGLSKKGKKDAKELAKKLSNIQFDRVYCSDLRRAKETLAEFRLKKEVIYTQALREKSWGIHEGKSFEEIQRSGIEYENFEQWIEALDGERMQTYIQNLSSFFYNTLVKNAKKEILICTHAGVIRTLISITQNISLEEAFMMNIPYASSYKIDSI